MYNVKSDAVCSEAILIRELQEDIADNGKLDCLRVPLAPPKDEVETVDQKNKRIQAQWDSGILILLKRLCI
jgi:hypothetical protein